MRPHGEIRQALAAAFSTLQAPAATWVQLAETAQVGRALAKSTVRNMAAAGELQVVGTAPGPSNRPMVLYAPKTDHEDVFVDLDSVLRSWHA